MPEAMTYGYTCWKAISSGVNKNIRGVKPIQPITKPFHAVAKSPDAFLAAKFQRACREAERSTKMKTVVVMSALYHPLASTGVFVCFLYPCFLVSKMV